MIKAISRKKHGKVLCLKIWIQVNCPVSGEELSLTLKTDPWYNFLFVAMGGQVPASYYTAPSRRLSTDTDLTKITVEKKSVFPVELTVTDVGSTLSWEFQTENYDIGFSVWFRPEGGIAEELVPLQRVNCHLVPEDGMLVCDKPGKYILKFDNSFSWCRRKHILYQVHVTPPNNGKMNYN
ncbi:SEC14-like protein 2 [Caerostris darwini]|uniref:SEC14-like protein 2 n=1 Tax=Caerostris darwini TaxID=1538125 RepID=A0AAV4V0U3_9ARAC|nr:SEC14-like protein 2 [Caerostris darwini]